MKCSSVFSKSIKAYNSGKRYIVNYGSARSGKTYSVLQLLYIIAKSAKNQMVITIAGKSLPFLKGGCIRDLEEILKDDGVSVTAVKNIADSIFRIGKSIIEFVPTSDIDKAVGPSRDILFVNEITGCSEKVIKQMAIRTKKCIFLDYNPSADVFIEEPEYTSDPEVHFIHSTYLENEFLPIEQVREIEKLKSNEFLWRVYGLGLKGRLDGAVYSNWEIGEFNTSIPYGYGLDFGYNPDPDVLIKCAVDQKRKTIYLHEEFRGNNISSENLADKIKSIVGNNIVYADSAEKRLIEDISLNGVYITKTKKGAGSILANIRLLQGYKIIVTPSSKVLIRELETYVWHDKKAGVPVDRNNHGCDAFSYYCRMVISDGADYEIVF